MATINLRNVDDELARGMKIAAATGGVTLKAWIESVVRERIGKPAKVKYMIPDEECLPKFFADEPAPTIKKNAKAIAARVPKTTVASALPSGHDHKTCRVYKCGACVAHSLSHAEK